MPLRVILDDRCLRRTLTGVGNYVVQLLCHAPRDGHVTIAPFYFTHLRRDPAGPQRLYDVQHSTWPSDLAAAGAASRQADAPPSHPRDVGGGRKPWWLRRIIQSGYGAAFRYTTRGRYDLYHEPNHIPIRCRLPTVTTIHDLSVLVHPEWHPADRVGWYEAAFAAGVRQTRRFLAASEFTRTEMVRRLGIPPERIHVTYQAPRAAFKPQTPDETAAARQALALPERFFLYVGTLEPRKNVAGLLDAYAALEPDLRADCPLLIAGAWGWKAQQLRARIERQRIAGDVRLLGFLQDRQLAALYGACTAMVWPTWYEGFGLPPLEAMACGSPVVVSDVASLPEVVGDAGLRLPPAECEAWTDAMRRLAADAALRADRQAASLRQAARFTWDRFIEDTLACYQAAC